MLAVLAVVAIWPMLASQALRALGPALVWWSLAYSINALWPSAAMLRDPAARLGLMAVGAPPSRWRAGRGVAVVRRPAGRGVLARLGVPFEALAALLLTGLTLTLLLLRYGRPQQVGQWLGFVCMAWRCRAAPSMASSLAVMAAALTSLSISLAHEGYHMAFRDELTGLPGRRALNERLQRMGRLHAGDGRRGSLQGVQRHPRA